MKTIIAIIGITFSYVFFKISPFFVFAILSLLSAGLILWMLNKIKMLPQFSIDVPPWLANKFQNMEDAMDHVSKSKQAQADKDLFEKSGETIDEPIAVVSPQELRRLEIEAENAEKLRLRERENIKNELLQEIEATRKVEHEAEYFKEHGISIEDNLINLENGKNELVSLSMRKVRLPQLDPYATND